ncbi:hypothetical protein [Thermomonospora amylolytica]|uniref:hypothetical protein n=1 Tax=Thermomonospora amylolytica TaxID=1411117 RepID=UPI000E6C25C7|nr:hypothetical protein [Thermomonospora amylolytica]
MDVVFTRTGERRYGVTVTGPGLTPRGMNPAPGYDDHIPHDLVHYVVEAELKLSAGLYGRAAEGGGSFRLQGDMPGRRERSRLQRRAKKREAHLRRRDHAGSADMARSERLAAVCDAVWRKRRAAAQGVERPPWVVPPEIPAEDRQAVERIVARLDEIAALWSTLNVGDSLTFTWPNATPVR